MSCKMLNYIYHYIIDYETLKKDLLLINSFHHKSMVNF